MNYILQKDFDWFGRTIPAGTRFIDRGVYFSGPMLPGSHVPMLVDYSTIRCSPDWFKEESVLLVSSKFYFGNTPDGRHYVHEFTTNHPIPVHLQDTIEKLIQEAINK